MIQAKGVLSHPNSMIVLDSGIGSYIYSKGKKYSYFAGNNYLGLASHPDIKIAAMQAVDRYGINFSASRQTTGTADIHLELESSLARFKGKQDAVVFASGYQGNSILLDILRDRYSSVFCDRNAHASILAGIPSNVESVFFYDHCDASDLGKIMDRVNPANPLEITDGVFALTGEIAPLDKIYEVTKRHNGLLVVDDAHSTGILGETGKGTPEHFHLTEDENVFQTETMSKALGGYGGFISGNLELTKLIRSKSAAYQASTALPPPVAAAGIASLKIINENPGLRLAVLKNAATVRDEIIRMGFRSTGGGTPIIPVIFDSSDRAAGLSLFLEEHGIIAPFMNYPVKVEMHQIRITVSALHTAGQIEILLDMLHQWMKRNGKG